MLNNWNIRKRKKEKIRRVLSCKNDYINNWV